MGRIVITFRDLFGIIKDKASISKAALLSSSSTLNLAVLRATTHTPSSPPDDRNISSLLLSGDGSRATASSLITALMDRLHRTGNCIVALKCLLIIHNIIKRGSFILQDQLSIFPTSGGYNYLKLSAFRDGATSATWSLSAWVRWYARYLETLLSTSRVLGYFICSSSSSSSSSSSNQISSLLNIDLIKDVDSLVTSIEEICKAPDSLLIENNLLVKEILGFLCNDYLSVVNETSTRLSELKERVSCLSFGESVELACALKRLEDCKERSLELFYLMKKPSIENMWGLAHELRDGVGVLKVFSSSRQGGYLVSREKASESARFERTNVLKSVRFQSGRFGVNRLSDLS